MKNTIPYGRQNITNEDIDEVVNVLKSDYLTQGKNVPEFESTITKITNSKYGIAVNSATSALHLACLALDVKPGDIVWTSPITFVASANCALYCGAEIDFVDIDPSTGLIDCKILKAKLEKAMKNKRLPKL